MSELLRMAGDAVIAIPWFGALIVAVYRRHVRVIGVATALITAAACALTSGAAAPAESLYRALMLLFSCLTLGATLVLPRRDCTPAGIGGILFILGSTLPAYSADNLLLLLAA